MNANVLLVNDPLVLIDLLVVAGAAVVLPVALDRWTGAWLAVAASTALAFSIGEGSWSAALAAPWILVALAATAVVARPVLRGLVAGRLPGLDDLASVAAPGFAVVAGFALLDSCGAWGLLDVGEPITRLTVVHFTFAGVATTVMGRAAVRAAAPAPGWRRPLATVGLALALVSPPVVGIGFRTGSAVAQVGGAIAMTAAAYALAACHLAEAWPRRRTRIGRLLAVSGLSVWVPMVLSVAWALAQHTDGPALSIPDMVRTHGSLNAIGFVGCGLAARWLADHERAQPARGPGDPPPTDGPSGGSSRDELAGVA